MSAQQDKPAGDPWIGRTMSNGRYRVIERLAAGGMGIVYLAEQLPLGRRVALKILEAKHTPDIDESFRQRFFLEAAAAAKLSHPNTIVVYDYGQSEEGAYYIAMEYLAGGTLDDHLKKKGPLSPEHAIHVGLQICSSLRDAHEHGLVHRDLKPGNIMFAPRARDPWFIKVLDFGLVKVVSGEEKDALGLTQSGVVMGSPRYMAPEQVRALNVDNRADVYSFGAVLYHALAGAPPFAAGNAFDAMTAHVTTPPPRLKDTWPDCKASHQLETVLMRCLEKAPLARFQDMGEVIAALQACTEDGAGLLASGSSYTSFGSVFRETLDDPDMDALGLGAHHHHHHHQPDASAPSSSGDALIAPPAGMLVSQGSLSPPPKSERSFPLRPIAIGAGVLLVLAIAAGATLQFWPSNDGGSEPAPTTVAVEPTPPPEPTPEPVEPTPTVRPVEVRSDPPGATARHRGRDLGDTPLDLVVPSGETWDVELSLDGHQSRTIVVSGGQPRVTVRLRPLPPPEPAPEPAQETGSSSRRRQPAEPQEAVAEPSHEEVSP